MDAVLPHQPIRQWVLSVPFPLRFLFASRPAILGRVLGIVYRAIATRLKRKAGYTKATAQTGAVTLIQRFGGAVNLNIHFHMLFLDGVYSGPGGSAKRFRWVKAPTSDELTQLTHTIAQRIGRCLERRGLLGRDADDSYLTAHERDKLERLCRYIARPAVSTQRLPLTRNGQIRYELQTPYNDGTTHVIFEPLEFFARLVTLPRVNLTRHHGVFAPRSQYRALVTRAIGGRKKFESGDNRTPAECRASMTWAQRLNRVFHIDIETCSECGGDVRIIASIKDPAVINKILAHLDAITRPAGGRRLPHCRAPPSVGLIEAS